MGVFRFVWRSVKCAKESHTKLSTDAPINTNVCLIYFFTELFYSSLSSFSNWKRLLHVMLSCGSANLDGNTQMRIGWLRPWYVYVPGPQPSEIFGRDKMIATTFLPDKEILCFQNVFENPGGGTIVLFPPFLRAWNALNILRKSAKQITSCLRLHFFPHIWNITKLLNHKYYAGITLALILYCMQPWLY